MSLQTHTKKYTIKGNLFYLPFFSIGNDIHKSKKKNDLRTFFKERKNVHSLRFGIVSHAPNWSETRLGIFYGFPFQSTNSVHQLHDAECRKNEKKRTENNNNTNEQIDNNNKKIRNRSVSFRSISHLSSCISSLNLFNILFIPVHSPRSIRINWDYWLIDCVALRTMLYCIFLCYLSPSLFLFFIPLAAIFSFHSIWNECSE